MEFRSSSIAVKDGPFLAPKLPVELWDLVCDKLGREDLAQLRGVSKFFLSFTRPFFYRFGTFSRLGVHFPYAPTPYPSLDLPELGNARLCGEERQRLLNGIRRLELMKHTTQACNAFYGLGGEMLIRKSKVDVLYIELHKCLHHEDFEGTLPGAFTHDDYDGFCQEPATVADARDEAHPRPDCRTVCHMLRNEDYGALGLIPRKVVIRNAPVRWNEPDQPERDRFRRWPSGEEFTVVLDSADRWHWYDYENGDLPRRFDCRLVPSWGFRPKPAATAEKLTVVFWQPLTDAELPWLPPCGHFFGTCDARSRTQSKCRAIFKILVGIAGVLAGSRIRHVTIVGAERIGALRYGNLLSHKTDPDLVCIPLHDIQSFMVEAIETTCRKFNLPQWTGKIDYVTFADWVKKDDWEDVFKRREVRPWL
ncbi:hypothetical protein A1Q2_03422 [Trichosporon asahii var. asahii CBS 8904]|uniref:F-box domain-containing protein n=1 Tax=Trichosporon asahii var. asahii (strain CBS 8904) TaxID=1220162 RepID=K1VE49_TRIAC|nr:hypothetical protein A1Q2_03422 [Trichosporon asahii var. asahii CBS 8904]